MKPIKRDKIHLNISSGTQKHSEAPGIRWVMIAEWWNRLIICLIISVIVNYYFFN